MSALSGAFKSKSVWFGLAVAVLSWAQATIAGSGLSPEQTGLVGTVIGGLIIVLRSLTNTSLSDKA
jgi:hypothetical protein